MNEDVKLAFLVEDDPVYMEFVKNFLTGFGFMVVPFSDSKSCLNQLKLKPDLIVLDNYLLNGESGLNLLKNIRRIDGKVPVVMMSAQVEEDNLETALKLGILDYIKKDMGAIVKLRSWIDYIKETHQEQEKKKHARLKRIYFGLTAIVVMALLFWLIF